MYDMTRRDIYDGNDEWDIERTLKEMRAQSKIKTAIKRKLAANKVEKYKKDITEGIEMQHITDTLPEEEPQPKTVGLF